MYSSIPPPPPLACFSPPHKCNRYRLSSLIGPRRSLVISHTTFIHFIHETNKGHGQDNKRRETGHYQCAQRKQSNTPPFSSSSARTWARSPGQKKSGGFRWSPFAVNVSIFQPDDVCMPFFSFPPSLLLLLLYLSVRNLSPGIADGSVAHLDSRRLRRNVPVFVG